MPPHKKILETIQNRTENWATARYFVPFCQNDDARLALVERLGEPKGTQPSDVRLELYWKGVRDYLDRCKKDLHRCKKDDEVKDWSECYERLFQNLPKKCFGGLQKQENYGKSGVEDWEKKLFDNLFNTEIDVVLETPSRLFIGEAKGEMTFGANSKLVLVHQLIRQYVMASVLIDRLKRDGQIHENKKVVPFVVVDDVDGAMKREQVKFMCRQHWLRKKNILDWKSLCSVGRA